MNDEIYTMIPNRDAVVGYLSRMGNIVFAYLFGSYKTGLQNAMSDIDLAVYVTDGLSLLEQGAIVSELEKMTGCDVDLVLLNNAMAHHPRLAYDVVFGGELLVSKNDALLHDYRRRTLHYFFDTEPLRRMVSAGLERRLALGAFAKFDDA